MSKPDAGKPALLRIAKSSDRHDSLIALVTFLYSYFRQNALKRAPEKGQHKTV